MGFLNDVKKILFGAKALGKHAAEQAVETGKEVGGEWLDKAQAAGKELADKTGDFAQRTAKSVEDLFDKSPGEEKTTPKEGVPPTPEPQRPLDFSAVDHPDELELRPMGKAGEKVLDAGKKVEKAAEEIGHKVLDAGEAAAEKFKETAEQVGAKVLEKGAEFLERAREFGSEVLHKAEEAAKKAGEERRKEGPGTLDELIQKAKDLGDTFEQKASDKDRTFTDSLKDAKAQGLGTHDDFFEKARRFAEGDHHATSTKPQISRDPEYKPTEKKGHTQGFEDNDGDGNDLIDDAIIEKP